MITCLENSKNSPCTSLADTRKTGVVAVDYRAFFNSVPRFLIEAFSFFLRGRGANRLRRETAPSAATTKDCPYRLSAVPL